MSTIRLQIENFFSIFDNVNDAFAGTLSHNSNADFHKMKDELMNETIPSIGEDRQNLKTDAGNVVSDYRKAFELKKAELEK